MSSPLSNVRPEADQVLADIADYVIDYRIESPLAYATAAHCLIDALGCGLEALDYPACTKLLGPLVPGTPYQLDPVQAAFDIGAMIRWLDFNDTWLAAEWGHPSDNLGGILATADWLSRTAMAAGREPLTKGPLNRTNLARRFERKQQDAILAASLDRARLEAMPVNEYVDLYATS